MTPEHQEIFRDLCTKVDDRSVLDAAIEHIAQLKADNERLREALEYALQAWQYDGISDEHGSIALEVESRLAATPEQSLTRHDNAIKEACCGIVFGQCSSDNEAQRIVNAIRATKEPE